MKRLIFRICALLPTILFFATASLFSQPEPVVEDIVFEGLKTIKEETVRKRLQVYHEQTKPLVDFYNRLKAEGNAVEVVKIDGLGSVNEIREKVLDALDK